MNALDVTPEVATVTRIRQMLKDVGAESRMFDICDELNTSLTQVNGAERNAEGNKRMSREMAEVNRLLLYAAHLADMIRVQMILVDGDHRREKVAQQADILRVNVMSHYHTFKGEMPPFLTT